MMTMELKRCFDLRHMETMMRLPAMLKSLGEQRSMLTWKKCSAQRRMVVSMMLVLRSLLQNWGNSMMMSPEEYCFELEQTEG